VELQVDRLLLDTGGGLATATSGRGPGGTLTVTAREEDRKLKVSAPAGGLAVEIAAGSYQLAAPLEFTAADSGTEVFVLGSGSNILVADAGIRGLVLDNRARHEETTDAQLTYRLESGTSFAAFARKMCRTGREGLAWAVGIPGTLGGAVVYNAGAYGGCLADVLTRVRLQGSSGRDEWIDAPALELVYRGSVFTRGQFAGKTVLEAELRLRPGGSSGGHHGLESIEQHLGTREYARLRVGIGRQSGAREITGYVLGRFNSTEAALVDRVLTVASDQAETWLEAGIQRAMSQFNGVVSDPANEGKAQ
jgi:UDP-N-acetylenolpyruvoylglucosamine reductase